MTVKTFTLGGTTRQQYLCVVCRTPRWSPVFVLGRPWCPDCYRRAYPFALHRSKT
jgi:hypothetical protein